MWWMTHCPNLFWERAIELQGRFSNRNDCKKKKPNFNKKTAPMCPLVLISSVFCFFLLCLTSSSAGHFSNVHLQVKESALWARSIAAFSCMSWPAPIQHPHCESALSNTRLEIHASHWTDCVSSTTLRAQLPEVLFIYPPYHTNTSLRKIVQTVCPSDPSGHVKIISVI